MYLANLYRFLMGLADREFMDHGLRADGIHLNPVPKLHTHSELEFNWVKKGWVEYTTMLGVRSLEAGQLVCFWGAFPHQILRMSEDHEGYWITLPHEIWLSWELPAESRQDLLSGAFRILSGYSQEHLESWFEDAKEPSIRAPIRRAMYLEMEACVLRSQRDESRIEKTRKDLEPARGGARREHAANLVQIITARYQDDLSIAEIAASAGISPEYATTVFRETMGISLKSYLTHLRVAHAQSLLLTTSKSVSEIGFESGFNTMSRFYSAFRDSCQMTPKAYRSSRMATRGR